MEVGPARSEVRTRLGLEEKKAKSLSMDKGGVLVAVWQDGDRVVRLFAGGDEFVPVKL